MDWFDTLIVQMKARADKQKNARTRTMVNGTIDAFATNKNDLIKLGQDNVMEFIGMIGRGEKTEAQEFFIRNTQDPEALISGVSASAGTIVNAPSIDYTEIAVKLVTAIGKVGAEILLTFIVGLL